MIARVGGVVSGGGGVPMLMVIPRVVKLLKISLALAVMVCGPSAVIFRVIVQLLPVSVAV